MSGLSILVVDDEESLRTLLTRRLEKEGYRIVTAADGGEALELLKTEAIDLILLDTMMPNVDGREVLKSVRREHASVPLPIIMITAMESGPDVVEALRLGANDYITKPVDFDLLLKRISVHLALKKGKGFMLGDYRLLDRVGAGGMGIVYAAVDVNSGQRLAIKVLRRAVTASDQWVLRFLREVRLAARLDHPNLVKCLHGGHDGETYFMAMELADGENLRDKIERGALVVDRAVDIARQIASAVATIHSAGLIHRDIKPDNVIVEANGVPRLTDFGITREIAPEVRLTDSRQWIGSVVYASPEQLRREEDERTDVYSMGATLYSMLTGREPFDHRLSYEEILQIKKRSPAARKVNREVPRALSSFVARTMAPNPNKRPVSMQAFIDELDAVWTRVKPW